MSFITFTEIYLPPARMCLSNVLLLHILFPNNSASWLM